MTNLNPTQHGPNSLTNLVVRWLVGWILVLASIPLAVAKGVVVLSGEIGKAAGMAYVEPFMLSRKDQK